MGTRWVAILDIPGEYADAHAARMQAWLMWGKPLDLVQSRSSFEIGLSEQRTAQRDRTLRFRDSDAEEDG